MESGKNIASPVGWGRKQNGAKEVKRLFQLTIVHLSIWIANVVSVLMLISLNKLIDVDKLKYGGTGGEKGAEISGTEQKGGIKEA